MFKPIPGHSEYVINEDGTVIKRVSSENTKWLKPSVTQYFIKDKGKEFPFGYWYVTLLSKDRQSYLGHMYNGNCHKNIAVHRLVAWTWISPQPEGMPWVNHEDGSKINNHYSNLKWGTIAYNIQHANKNGLIKRKTGAAHWNYGQKAKASTRKLMSAAKLGARHPAHIGLWVTPMGSFESCSLAAKVIGLNRQSIYIKCKSNAPGYSLVKK